eukprot:TRINITY_DN64883_c0_g1_i1.p1 TRINITY_DN64883_c0_g1~~TRINITY_DN64883_c0_g1_i1.p1  ORF type:complete len:482 (-),score=60.28 TRINITY_DN64883_c0_g1_i1:16-1461(-)
MIVYSSDGFLPFSYRLLCMYHGSVIPKAAFCTIPSLGLTFLLSFYMDPEDFKENLGAEMLGNSLLWAALGTCCWYLLTFRLSKAYSRFWDGTTLLNQMFGEWFDAASCLVAFSSLARRKGKRFEEVDDFRHTLARLMSLCHASALEEISNAGDDHLAYPVIDIGGLDRSTLQWLVQCKFDTSLNFNRVEVILHMIQTLVVHAHDTGVLQIPPPILSRVFQTLSRGQVNLANCKKMTSTLFPFPCAQLTAVLLCFFSVSTPFIMTTVCKNSAWACVFSFLPIFGSYCINYIARELEMPFGEDPNDLPLDYFQEKMNSSLLMLIRPTTDLVPHRSEDCNKDFEVIKANLLRQRPRDFVGISPAGSDDSLLPPEEKVASKGVSKEDAPRAEVKAVPAAASQPPVAKVAPQSPEPRPQPACVVAELSADALAPFVETLRDELSQTRAVLRQVLPSSAPRSSRPIAPSSEEVVAGCYSYGCGTNNL